MFWLATGLIFQFSRKWWWVATRGTSIVTLLMVLLILNTRKRHTRVLSLKLDQLQRTIKRRQYKVERGETGRHH
jgi:low affinity Fe/Cu permease